MRLKKFCILFLTLLACSKAFASGQCTAEFKSKEAILRELVDLKVEIDNLVFRAQHSNSHERSMALVLTSEFNNKMQSARSGNLFTEADFNKALEKARGESRSQIVNDSVEQENARAIEAEHFGPFTVHPTLSDLPIRFSPSSQISEDGNSIVTSEHSHGISVVDLNQRGSKNILTTFYPVLGFALSPGGTKALVAFKDGSVSIYDITSSSRIVDFPNIKNVTAIAYHPIENKVAIASGNEILIFDTTGPMAIKVAFNEVLNPEGFIRKMSYSPDGLRIAFISNDSRAQALNQNLRPEENMFGSRIGGNYATSFAFGPTGNEFFVADASNEIKEFRRKNDRFEPAFAYTSPNLERIVDISVDPAGENLLACYDTNKLLIQSLINTNNVQNLIFDQQRVLSSHFSKDGKTILVVFRDGTIKILRRGIPR